LMKAIMCAVWSALITMHRSLEQRQENLTKAVNTPGSWEDFLSLVEPLNS